jgi:tetratricopeptide (TPR) repeat protein
MTTDSESQSSRGLSDPDCQRSFDAVSFKAVDSDAEYLQLRVLLERAREKRYLRDYKTAEAVLQDLLHRIGNSRTGSPLRADPTTVRLAALAAAGTTELGRLFEWQGRHQGTRRAFEEAVRLFAASLPATKEPIGQDLSDYGFSLMRTGAIDEAHAQLKRGEDLLHLAQHAAPRNGVIELALAENFEIRGLIDEAIVAYCQAAYCRAWNGQTPEGLALIDHALVLRSGDPGTLGLKAQILLNAGRASDALIALNQIESSVLEGFPMVLLRAEALVSLNSSFQENPH